MLNKTWLKLVFLSILGLMLVGTVNYSSLAKPSSKVTYLVDRQAQYNIHTISIPAAGNFQVVPALADELSSIKDFARQHNAIAAINGGYFDPVNHKTTSYVIRDSQIVADPRFNARLIDNPDLKPYLGKILNRAEFRRYLCGEETKYDIQLHSAPIPSNCTLKDALGGGPALLPQDTAIAEAFTAYRDGERIRDAIGFDSPNARSAIAINNSGDIILAMVEQKPNVPVSGISLPHLADYLSSLGATKAINLDGGSSSALYFEGQTIYGKLDKNNKKIERNIKSVLLITSE